MVTKSTSVKRHNANVVNHNIITLWYFVSYKLWF